MVSSSRLSSTPRPQGKAAAQAALGGRLERRGAIARVGDGGDARRDGLDGAEFRACQVLLGSQRRLDVDQTDDPVAELGVVEDAAERRVLDVTVAVDEPGHDHAAAEIDKPRLGMGGREVGRRTDGDDALAAHGERAVGEHRRRHGQQPVGAIDGDVVVRGDRLDRRSRHAGTQGQAPFVRKEYRGAPRTVANRGGTPALPARLAATVYSRHQRRKGRRARTTRAQLLGRSRPPAPCGTPPKASPG